MIQSIIDAKFERLQASHAGWNGRGPIRPFNAA